MAVERLFDHSFIRVRTIRVLTLLTFSICAGAKYMHRAWTMVQFSRSKPHSGRNVWQDEETWHALASAGSCVV